MCYKLQNRKNDKNSQKEDSANVTIADVDSNDFVYSADYVPRSMENWIIDSNATYHMCPNINWFSTYSPTASGVILMGNYSPCKAIGIGTVKI